METKQNIIKIIWVIRIITFIISFFLLFIVKLPPFYELSIKLFSISLLSGLWTLEIHEYAHIVVANLFIKDSMYLKNMLRAEFKKGNFQKYQLRIIALAGMIAHITVSFLVGLLLLQICKIPLIYGIFIIIFPIVIETPNMIPIKYKTGPSDMYFVFFTEDGLKLIQKK